MSKWADALIEMPPEGWRLFGERWRMKLKELNIQQRPKK